MIQGEETGKVANILAVLVQENQPALLRGRNWFNDKSKEGTALKREALRILRRGIIK